jgi:hypothetical protein
LDCSHTAQATGRRRKAEQCDKATTLWKTAALPGTARTLASVYGFRIKTQQNEYAGVQLLAQVLIFRGHVFSPLGGGDGADHA